ncbi:MAG: hypothetical protein KA135_01720, partial [Halioglobus sp.]|nr:hypothetical protein [Halioglobus sp.]
MKATREDRVEGTSRSGRFSARYLLLALAVIAAGGLLWRTVQDQSPAPAPPAVAVAELAAEPNLLPPAEDIPPRTTAATTVVLEAPAEPVAALPALADSDPMVREQLSAAATGPLFDRLLQQPGLVQQGASLIDGLSRGLVLRKLLPIDPPAE